MKGKLHALFISLYFATLASLTWSETTAPETVNWADDVVIIDVRSRAEWNQAHLEGSIWIPWAQIEQGVTRYSLEPEQTLAFYCAAGIRAERAIRKLEKIGYKNTINLISLSQASSITGRKIID